MPDAIDITGKQFGSLLVIRRSLEHPPGATRGRSVWWLCQCVCGNRKLVRSYPLRHGKVTSCGCLSERARVDRLPDLTGRAFGLLKVVALAGTKVGGTNGKKRRLWTCECRCGTRIMTNGYRLLSGHTKSCGSCARSAARTRHGHTRRREGDRIGESGTYSSYIAMLARCHRPTSLSYRYYGARGIKVCDRWRESFANFLADMGERPSRSHSLDRLDTAADYTPANCRWATRTEQNRNTRANRVIAFRGEEKCLSEWAEEYGLPAKLVGARLNQLGWSVAKSLTTPHRDAPVVTQPKQH